MAQTQTDQSTSKTKGRGWHGDPEGHANAGRKGGTKVSRNRSHMAEIGRRGGAKVSQDRSHMAEIGLPKEELNMRQRYRKSSGFTLVEMVIVMAVITVLIGATVPLIHGMTENATLTKCESELNTLKSSIISYWRNNGYRLPTNITTIGILPEWSNTPASAS